MENLFFSDLFAHLALGSALISIAIGLTCYSRLDPRMRVVFTLIIISISTDALSFLLSSFKVHNIWLLNLYTILEFSCFAVFYWLLFKKSQYHEKTIIWILSAILLVLILFSFSTSFSKDFNQLTPGIEAIVFILISVIYFYRIILEMEFDSPFANPIFWINSAILIYFSGAFFFFIFSDIESQQVGVWAVHNFMKLIFNILITIGFWKASQK